MGSSLHLRLLQHKTVVNLVATSSRELLKKQKKPIMQFYTYYTETTLLLLK